MRVVHELDGWSAILTCRPLCVIVAFALYRVHGHSLNVRLFGEDLRPLELAAPRSPDYEIGAE